MEGRRFLVPLVTALALAGCTDKAPTRPTPTLSSPTTFVVTTGDKSVVCETQAVDTRNMTIPNGSKATQLAVDIYKCVTDDTKREPSKVVVVFEPVVDNSSAVFPLTSFIVPPPNGENDSFRGQGSFANNEGECLIIQFEAKGYKFAKADVFPCPSPS